VRQSSFAFIVLTLLGLFACAQTATTEKGQAANLQGSGGQVVTATTVPPTLGSTPTAPPLIGVYGYQSAGGADCGTRSASAGYAVNSIAFWGVESCSVQTTAFLQGCVGHAVSGNACQLYLYIDTVKNGCAGPGAGSLWNYISNTGRPTKDAGFNHSASPSSAANRVTTTTPSKCGAFSGGSSANTYLMNVGDATANTYAALHIWQPTNFPTPSAGRGGYYVFADDSNMAGQLPGYPYSEFNQSYLWAVGTGPNGTGYSWDQGIARMDNAMCTTGQPCYHVINNALGGTVNPCTTLTNAACEGNPRTCNNCYNNQNRLADFCAALTHQNVDALLYENQFNGRFNPTYKPYYFSMVINTGAYLENAGQSTNCANTKLMVLAQPTINASNPGIRDNAEAIKWLLCNKKTGMDDFVVTWFTTYGLSSTEIPWFPEDNVTPTGCENPPATYTFNGRQIENGTGCENAGDSGGSVKLVAGGVNNGCPSSTTPVYMQQYQKCWIGNVNEGKCAVFINTSASAVTIKAGMFNNDPGTSYAHVAAWSGNGEGTRIMTPAGSTVNIAACSNATYCVSTYNPHAHTFTLGTTTCPAQDACFLFQ
jgi:hypothetical protein